MSGLRPIALLLTLLALAGPAPGQDVITPIELEGRIVRAFEREDYAAAAALLERYLETAPSDVNMIYNLACTYSRLGELDKAASTLFRAVQAGFRDFDFMAADPDLVALHGHETYLAIIEAAHRVDAERSSDILGRWKATYGTESYRYETDDARRLAYATALDDVAHAEMRAMLERQADQMVESLFGAPPSYFILIAVPTLEHANRLFPEERMGGIYEPARRRIITRDIGNALRHEFVHAYHYGHMNRLGQVHPIGIQEGMAALYEDYDVGPDGTFTFLPNDRHNIVKNQQRARRLRPWTRLFSMTSEEFMRNSGALYPQVRSVFEYVADRGVLSEWYAAYVKSFAEDTSGIAAFESVLGKPIAEIERDYRAWLDERPHIDNTIDTGDASLGVISSLRSSNAGVAVEEIVPGSAAARVGIRVGDVIVAVDGRSTRTFTELVAVIGARDVGDRVEVRVRRGDRYFVVTTRLTPR